MDIDFLYEDFEAMSYAMTNFSPDDAFTLKNVLSILRDENHLDKMFYWGRINTAAVDYNIAFGTTKDDALGLRYFYSKDNIDWKVLPPKGGPLLTSTKRLSVIGQYVKSSFDDNSIKTDIIDRKEYLLGELCRKITETSGIVPRGYLYKTADNKIVYNRMSKGLNNIEASDFTNFHLLRRPLCTFENNLQYKPNYDYALDFLDSILEVQPKGLAFSVKMENLDQVVVIRSLIWIGMTFVHRLKTKNHGFLYIGSGQENFDLLFQLASHLQTFNMS